MCKTHDYKELQNTKLSVAECEQCNEPSLALAHFLSKKTIFDPLSRVFEITTSVLSRWAKFKRNNL